MKFIKNNIDYITIKTGRANRDKIPGKNKMKTYNEIFAIIVKGDSYYSKRIKRQSYRILKDEMHNVVGLFGNWDGDNVGTDEEIDDKMEAINNELNFDYPECDFERGDVQIEDDLVFYEKVSVQDLIDDYCDGEDDEYKDTLLEMLNLKK